MKSVFMDKKANPRPEDLEKAVGNTFSIWQSLAEFTKQSFPGATEGWNYTSEKFGWSFRISDKKRVLLYLLPRDKFFKVAFVFGQKATDEVLKSNVAESIKKELKKAKVYAEGRGIRIEIRNKDLIEDLKKLIEIKIKS